MTFILLAVVLLIGLIYISDYFYKKVIKRRLINEDTTFKEYVNKKLIDEEFYYSLTREDLYITSKDGLNLKGTFIEAQKTSNKYVVLVHGISIGPVGSLKYLDAFYSLDFNILIIHQRRHGKSEGRHSTYGYHEKQDLFLWVSYLRKIFGNDIIIGLHGESMGAATVLQYTELDQNISFIIADCGFSDLSELLKFQINYSYPNILRPLLNILINLINIRAIKRAKFNFRDTSPIKAVENSEIPTLFIHGKNDSLVPWFMSEKMYQVKTKGIKELYFVEEAAHAEAIKKDKKTYDKKITDFINKVLSTREC
ncbi:hypothetical protein CPJCM30710_12040 [Clostridium polyendosporum]|uniref:AB hydrolase-1 domain-containing protein n=1 Tax=Clostridium polyendosporum TaxID=69208 RepID=A0A919S0U3_9CLOT|nr:alpha/beta hydrolase [Clostridium polyendosporum]GIM28538.1 hypothetical protein CPJCM30710_12040 [Clostridium polyendosporum]